MTPTVALTVVERACDLLFGKPLVMNVFRGQLAEAIIAVALEPEWEWCSADYANWDFQNAEGLRLEVRSSAARQSWTSTSDRVPDPRFDIRARRDVDRAVGSAAASYRFADIYIFAYHPRTDVGADHRDPSQWRFHCALTSHLPRQNSISISALRKLRARRASVYRVSGGSRAFDCQRQARVTIQLHRPFALPRYCITQSSSLIFPCVINTLMGSVRPAVSQ